MRSSANCAAFLDKATRRSDTPAEWIRDEKGGQRRSDYASYRDAFFLLSVMNQFTINVHFNGAAAEKLLKVALFSQQLRLPVAAGGSIEEVRLALARDAREARKRGTVQCFLSQIWFIFGMVISIQQSFGLLGENAPAQNLALGLAMVWFPVLMLCTVVDRNPAIPEATQRQLNTFLHLVREALLRDAGRFRYDHHIPKPTRVTSFDSVVSGSPIKTVHFSEAGRSSPNGTMYDVEFNSWFDSPECDTPDLQWIDSISAPALDEEGVFYSFAGQGRHHWHYGVAYPIIRGLKKDGISNARRGWSYDTDARQKLIATKRWDAKDRIHSWDLREFWQVLLALTIVWTSMLAAFLIAYFTPTVGLGCRAKGYMQFAVFCTGQGAIEMLTWAVTPHHKHETKFYKRARFYAKWTIRICECFNLSWLLYIIFAQALGAYNTCQCKCSTYGIGGGYINVNNILTPGAKEALPFWLAGTIMGCTMMAISFVFIAWEWVTQSHMSTEDYQQATKGLRTTRRFKTWTRWLAPLQA